MIHCEFDEISGVEYRPFVTSTKILASLRKILHQIRCFLTLQNTTLPCMDFHEISELDQKSVHKQYIKKSKLLNTIYYDSACLNFCECEFLQILVIFWQSTNHPHLISSEMMKVFFLWRVYISWRSFSIPGRMVDENALLERYHVPISGYSWQRSPLAGEFCSLANSENIWKQLFHEKA